MSFQIYEIIQICRFKYFKHYYNSSENRQGCERTSQVNVRLIFFFVLHKKYMFDLLFHFVKCTVEWLLHQHFPEHDIMFRIDYDEESDFMSISKQETQSIQPKSSKILDHLSCIYHIQDIPQDGNCFYHSLVISLNLKYDAYTLRSKVANVLTKEEINLIRATRWTENTQNEDILKGIKTTEWADHIEICACLRLFPNVLLVIIDDEFDTISFHGKIKTFTNAIFLRRYAMHYEIVKLDEKSTKNILKMKHKRETVHIKTKIQKKILF